MIIMFRLPLRWGRDEKRVCERPESYRAVHISYLHFFLRPILHIPIFPLGLRLKFLLYGV